MALPLIPLGIAAAVGYFMGKGKNNGKKSPDGTLAYVFDPNEWIATDSELIFVGLEKDNPVLNGTFATVYEAMEALRKQIGESEELKNKFFKEPPAELAETVWRSTYLTVNDETKFFEEDGVTLSTVNVSDYHGQQIFYNTEDGKKKGILPDGTVVIMAGKRRLF